MMADTLFPGFVSQMEILCKSVDDSLESVHSGLRTSRYFHELCPFDLNDPERALLIPNYHREAVCQTEPPCKKNDRKVEITSFRTSWQQ